MQKRVGSFPKSLRSPVWGEDVCVTDIIGVLLLSTSHPMHTHVHQRLFSRGLSLVVGISSSYQHREPLSPRLMILRSKSVMTEDAAQIIQLPGVSDRVILKCALQCFPKFPHGIDA